MEIEVLAKKVGVALQENKLFIVTAESCTGGMLAATLTAIPGSSAYFERGFVTYSNVAKQEILGIDSQILAKFGAVSAPVAQAMAEGALHNSRAQVSVAITGIAGPDGGSEHKPVGTVCFAWIVPKQPPKIVTEYFLGTRAFVRTQAVKLGLLTLYDILQLLKY